MIAFCPRSQGLLVFLWVSLAIEVVAAKSGATWPPTPIASTRNLDGFHLAAAGATLAWDALDPTALPPGKLEIQQQ